MFTMFTTSKNERGNVTNVTVGDRTVTLFTPTKLTEHKTVGGPMQTLSDGITAGAEFLQAKAPDLTATGFAKLANETVIARVKGPFNGAVAALAEAITDNKTRTNDKFVPAFTAEQTPAVRAELRTYGKSLPLPALMDMIGKDAGLANAVVEGGHAMSGLPADIFDRVRDEMAIGNLATKLMAQRTYRTAPSPADPIGGQPDHGAARQAAEAVIKGLSDELDTLTEARGTLALVIDAVAIMTDQTRDGAFALLTAEG